MYGGPIIDCDIHNNPVSKRDYLPYLPSKWREFVEMPGGGALVPLNPATQNICHPEGVNKRLDSYPDDGRPSGSSYELLCEQLLDPYGVEIGILGHDVGAEAGLTNPGLALAMVQAMNDWLADTWLSRDSRLRGALLVPTQVPEDAAKEIRRAGQDGRFATALLSYNGLGKPLGHPANEPIFEAAAELDLPIHLHVNLGETNGSSAAHLSGGMTHHSKYEIYFTYNQPTLTHLVSLIVHGVFERYPTLKVLATETGQVWLPWLATSLDANYELLRRESSWVKRRPSEYLRERLFVGTQPCEATADDRGEFVAEMSRFEGIDDMLCFTSDYPHWDADEPTYVHSILPKAWHEGVFHENARRVLRLGATPEPRRQAAALAPSA
jgi:predicted TIM-barrel fold metal-dependent hydrolase